MTKTYAVAIKDVFDKWIAPVSGGMTRKFAREHAHYLLVKGWDNNHGEIKAVRVVEWNGFDATRKTVKAL